MNKFVNADGNLEVSYDGGRVVRKGKNNSYEYELTTERKSPDSKIEVSYYAVSKIMKDLDMTLRVYGDGWDPSVSFIYPTFKESGEFHELGEISGMFDNESEEYRLTIRAGDYFREFIQRLTHDAEGNREREYTFNDSQDRNKMSIGNGFSMFESVFEEEVYDVDEKTEEEFLVGIHGVNQFRIFIKDKLYFLYRRDTNNGNEELYTGVNEALVLYSEDGCVYNDEDEEVDLGCPSIYHKFVLPRIEVVEGAFDMAIDNFPEISSSLFELDHKIEFCGDDSLSFDTTKDMSVEKILKRVRRKY